MRPCNLGIGDQRLTLLDIISDVIPPAPPLLVPAPAAHLALRSICVNRT